MTRAILRLQKMSGAPTQGVGPRTKPIDDLVDFDSLRCLEAMILIEKDLGTELLTEENLFASAESGHPISIEEAAERLLHFMAERSGRNRD